MDKIYKTNKTQEGKFLTGFSIEEILKATKGRLLSANKAVKVSGISTDTRTIKKGNLFIALKGDNFDGHNFINTAFEKGASCAIIKMGSTPYFPAKNKNRELTLIMVRDTKRALGDIAAFYRQRLKMPIIGITGSNGKTTTKDMIAHILSKKNKTAKTFDTENNLIGVPLTLLKIKNESFAVIEMGTNSPGEIDYLAGIIKPYIGIITNIGPSHLEGLKTEKGILKEKLALFNHLDKSGYAIINNDDKLLSSVNISAIGGNKKLTYGTKDKNCDYYAEEIKIEQDGIAFILNKIHKFKLPVFGLCNVYNALASIAACYALGVSIKDCRDGFLDFKPAKMRFDISRYNGICIINDAYNSNPLSMEAALMTLNQLDATGRKIVVTADMLELGKDKNKLHYEIGSIISKSGIDVLITVGQLSAYTAKGAIENGMGQNSVKSFKNNDDAAKFLSDIKKPNDTILVKGSRAMKMEKLIQCFITSYIR